MGALTTRLLPATVQKEFYDHTTTKGQLEPLNTAGSDPRTESMYEMLTNEIIPNELAAILPPPPRAIQEGERIAHILYRDFIARQGLIDILKGGLQKLLGYGEMF